MENKLFKKGISLVDKNNRALFWASANIEGDEQELLLDEIVKRYNDYGLLKVYVIGLMLAVLTLTFALCTRVTI